MEHSEKWKLEHSYICKLFAEGATVVLAAAILYGLACILYIAVGKSEMVFENTGYSYRADLMVGYMQCGFEYLPENGTLPLAVSGKTFCITFLALLMVAKGVPLFFCMNCFRKTLKKIEHSYSPFLPEIAKEVKRIGKVFIKIGLFSNLVIQSGMSIINYHRWYVENPIEFTWIFAGVVVLLTGDIFSRGCELQQFSDETL